MGDYELYHAERKHKYIKKIGNRYFYTQQEIQKYLAGRNVSSEAKGSVNSGSNGVGKTARKEQAYKVSNYVSTRTASAADQMSKPLVKSAKKGKLRREINDAKEAVAEATGRRDVYFEAKKVTEKGRTYYDDDNAELKTGKKDRRGKVGDDGAVYTKKGTMQYDNEYTRELNKKTRERGKKKLKKMATSPVRSLKKQTDRGKKKIESLYKPKKATVTIEDRIDSRTGKHF